MAMRLQQLTEGVDLKDGRAQALAATVLIEYLWIRLLMFTICCFHVISCMYISWRLHWLA
jgi:hypothetical protein